MERKLEHLLRHGGLSRRDFMTRASALGLTIGAASSMWSTNALAAPKTGGHLRIGMDGGAASDTFNPMVAIGTDHVTQSILSCYDTLTEVGPDGSPQPSLCEGWETSADGKTWRFKLRSGVEFHNGKALTVDDVIWSLMLHTTEDNKFAEGKSITSGLESMTADGDTVVMVQKEVNFDLPMQLSAFGLIIGPEGTTDWDAGVGTGPYKLESWEPGQRFTAQKYANYYRNDDGHFDSIEHINIADQTARGNALLSGSVDVIANPATSTAAIYDRNPKISLVEAPGTRHNTTAMRTDTDPLTDNHLRMAIKLGIKRQEIVGKVFGGFGYVGNDHPIGRNQQFFNADLAQREYDPEKAKWHFDKSGAAGNLPPLEVSAGAVPGSDQYGLLIQASLKEAGIDIDLKTVPADGYWSNNWLKSPWCAVYWAGRPTVDWMLTSTYVSTSSWNDTYFKNERFDALLNGARGEADQAKRREMYYECQQILHDEGGTTVIAFGSNLIGTSTKLAHGDVGGSRPLDDQRLGRRWWFA